MEHGQNVLVLCTRNSARSQMAEGLGGDRFHVYSAGLRPDRVHPLARQAMDEIGIDISDQYSKDVGSYVGKLTVRHLIIVCEHAEQNCPKMFLGALQRHYWPIDDPAAAPGVEEEQIAAFRRVRGEIDAKTTAWLEPHFSDATNG